MADNPCSESWQLHDIQSIYEQTVLEYVIYGDCFCLLSTL